MSALATANTATFIKTAVASLALRQGGATYVCEH